MTSISSLNNEDYVSVSKFFIGSSILVTGGSGFVGKVLIEKLLRSCPGIENIYLLLRPKRGQDIYARLQQILDSPLFEKLRSDSGCVLEKIVPIQGDIEEPDLGISLSDQQLLANNINVVFHSAATVKFDEPLKLGVSINILGTKRLLQLCRSMNMLKALIHVSTSFCNCDREEVKEEIYPLTYDPEEIIRAMEWMDDDLVQSITPTLLGKKPNTYTLTKALTEHLLLKESGDLPVAIVRPSIVLSSISEPMAGWIDNWYGPTGLIAAASKGIFRTMYCQYDNVANLVPVDYVINLMIVAAWKTAITRPNKIMVYNCSTEGKSPVTWNEFVSQCVLASRKYPLGDIMWYPGGRCKSNYLYNKLCIFLQHFIPAIAIDTFSWIIGKKPIMMKLHQKLDKAADCLHYFSTRHWHFVGENTANLFTSLSPEDKQIFPFDMRDIKWPSYIDSYVLGIRHFIFKEDPTDLDKARKALYKYYYIEKICQLIVVVLMWRFLFK